MEVCASCSLVMNSSIGSSTDPHDPIQYSSTDLSMNDLKTCLTEVLGIEDVEISANGFNLSPRKNDIGNEVMECECKDSDKSSSGNSDSVKCFSKCDTFPPLRGPKSSGDAYFGKKGKEDITAEFSQVNGSTKPLNQCFSRSVSLPKLVSALKGSREKQGIPLEKLSVTWAPDVYDPTPTSVSHVPSNKNQRHRCDGKRHGKQKKSRGKSSQGKRGKDKKKGRKNSGASNKSKPFHEDTGVDGFVKHQPGGVDIDAGIPDPFCGRSFLKTCVTNLHFPVAEAT